MIISAFLALLKILGADFLSWKEVLIAVVVEWTLIIYACYGFYSGMIFNAKGPSAKDWIAILSIIGAGGFLVFWLATSG